MKLLGSTKNVVDKDKPKLKVKIYLNQNLLKQYQCTVIQSKMQNLNTEFSSVEVWFTDQSSKALEIEDNVNLTLIIGQLL